MTTPPGCARSRSPPKPTPPSPPEETVMSPDLVLRHDDGAIARLTLNDPERANVLSWAMIEALDARISEAAGDAAIRVIVLDAAGKVFCAGHDLGEMRAT